MSTTADAVQPATSPRDLSRRFLLERLGSLFSVLPLGVWTLDHLWSNLAAYSGPRAWQEEVTGHASFASVILVSTLVIGPLFWHMIWGLMRLKKSRPSTSVHWFSNVRYWVQRLSAMGLMAFLGAHLFLAWFKPRFLEGHAESFRDIASEMNHHAPTTIVYALGILAVAYHLSNGLWSFAMGWGLTVSRSAQEWMERLVLVLLVAFLVLGWGAEYGLYVAGASYAPVP